MGGGQVALDRGLFATVAEGERVEEGDIRDWEAEVWRNKAVIVPTVDCGGGRVGFRVVEIFMQASSERATGGPDPRFQRDSTGFDSSLSHRFLMNRQPSPRPAATPCCVSRECVPSVFVHTVTVICIIVSVTGISTQRSQTQTSPTRTCDRHYDYSPSVSPPQ